MSIKFLYSLLFILCFTGCQRCKDKTKEPEPEYHFADQPDLYAYAYFLPGTYWVYEDSISGILDSVYVTSAKKDTYTNGDAEVAKGFYRGTFSRFSCNMLSSYDHYRYENWMDQSYEVTGSVPTVNREKYIMPGSGNNAGKTIHTAIVPVGKSLGVSSDYVTYENYYNAFVVNTHTYTSTQKWFNATSNCDDDQNTFYYLSKNIGIVRREQTDSNRTWNLVRYHIIQ